MNNNEQWRLFVAVDMPVNIQQEIGRIQEQLQQENIILVRFVQPEVAHLTLKFLGSIDQNVVPLIQDALCNITFPVLQAQLGSAGLFKKAGGNGILFVDIVCPDLSHLAKQIDKAVSGFCSPETRSFVNHVTIARIKSVSNTEALDLFIERYEVPPYIFSIESFRLKRSILSSNGPIYEDIEEYWLEK